MTNEFEVLKSVESKNTITQRELAKRTGLSLGAVNVLIKRLIHKGLLKIEHINSRTMRYILTPKGLMEKARLTYQYIVISYNYISDIEHKIEHLIANKPSHMKIALFGEKDELFDIIISKLKAMGESYKFIDDASKLRMYNNNEYIIIIWNPDQIEGEPDQQKNLYNILNNVF